MRGIRRRIKKSLYASTAGIQRNPLEQTKPDVWRKTPRIIEFARRSFCISRRVKAGVMHHARGQTHDDHPILRGET